jgi:hypothetical protein
MRFKEGDTVLVSGATISKKGIKEIHKALCVVFACGKYDVFVEKLGKEKFQRYFIVPIEKCQRINEVEFNSESELTKPKIGNLVMSVEVSYASAKVQKIIGRVEEIMDYPGKNKMASIRASTKLHIVMYDSLIILEE